MKGSAVFAAAGALVFSSQSIPADEAAVAESGQPAQAQVAQTQQSAQIAQPEIQATANELLGSSSGDLDGVEGSAQGSMDFGKMVVPVLQQLGEIFTSGGGELDNFSSGESNTLKIKSGFRDREAIVKVPSHTGNSALPVLFAFPGWLGPPQEMADYSGLHQTAEGSRALVVYMKGVADAWEGAPYAETNDGEDIQFVKDTLAELKKSYNVDSKKVYAVGLSNGGGFVNKLACRAPEILAGGVSVAGAYYDDTDSNCVGDDVPMLFMHGSDDTTVNINGGTRHSTHYRSVNEVASKWADRNLCSSSQTTTIGNVKTKNYNCMTPLKVMTVNGGGHTWFPTLPSATDKTWEFLS